MRRREIVKKIDEIESRWDHANTTSFYSVVVPIRNKARDARVDVYATRLETRSRKRIVKLVESFRSDDATFKCRDIFRGYMGGFRVDFSDMTRQCRHYAEMYYKPECVKTYLGKWDEEEYRGWNTPRLIYGPYLNDFTGTKFEHCCVENSGLHFMKFVHCWNISHSVEFLVKAGFQRFITPAFVKRLKIDKKMFNIFRSNIDAIRRNNYGIDELNRAVAHGITLEEAHDRIEASKEFSDSRYYVGGNIPKEIDRYELFKWCKKNNVEPREYRRYVNYVDKCGENILAYGVTYPRDFKTMLERYETEARRLERIERQRLERENRREERRQAKIDKMNRRQREEYERKERQKQAEKIAKIAMRLTKLEDIEGNEYKVVIPRSANMLLREGNAMKNCIGRMGYDEKIADGKSIILFLRGKGGRKNVDVEIRIERDAQGRVKFAVAQCYEPCNQIAPEAAQKFAEELAIAAKKILYRKAA